MALNIKNPRVIDLARQAASRAGTTQVAAVEAALEAYLRGLDRAASAQGSSRERAARTLAEIQNHLTEEDRAEIKKAMVDMYDEAGLPVR